MALKLPFLQVDVFTSSPFKGNPVAVVNCMGIDESLVSDQQLQAIANWTNLSETTFLFKATTDRCDYKLRIFTPTMELPFAGHPTIGSCKAFLQFTGQKNAKSLMQECQLGIVSLTISDEGKISFKAERADVEEIPQDAIDEYRKSLQIDCLAAPKLLQVGPAWVVYLAADAESCYNANPDFAQMAATNTRYGHSGIILAGKKPGSSQDYEMRAFAPTDCVLEDPVCGSGSIALIRYLQDLHRFSETTNVSITQGGRLKRQGQIFCQIKANGDGKFSYISEGNAIIVIEGSINI
ncbi:hypothetical protein HG536_0E03640 [Torulaspora globosa]|uniref:Phenazine biosynthesis protein n=1 Tax=Torulaspora globosa TaxID=48254 RepID=A0A7G3ZIW7_9SACH|nr:uncharacterized protein HG536_0E03640 [Torulaspora globosa]QLL33453.1 hypothetical protein HG536_0E03640 [Torulaspora globosa]